RYGYWPESHWAASNAHARVSRGDPVPGRGATGSLVFYWCDESCRASAADDRGSATSAGHRPGSLYHHEYHRLYPWSRPRAQGVYVGGVAAGCDWGLGPGVGFGCPAEGVSPLSHSAPTPLSPRHYQDSGATPYRPRAGLWRLLHRRTSH